MKTRQELQKEVNWLKSELNEVKNAGKSASIWHEYYLNRSKKLETELEKSKENTERLKNLLEIQETEIDKFNDIANRYTERYNQLKSLNLFQLIRWWFNAKN